MNFLVKLDPIRIKDPCSNSTSLQCVICHEIALNPKECIVCQNLFCEDCLKVWLEIKEVCPCFCSEQFMQTKQAHKFIRDLISNLRVKCINYDVGCNEIVRFESLQSHEKTHCLYQKIKCPKKFCSQSIFLKDRDNHIKSCLIEQIECSDCKQLFLKSEFMSHNCINRIMKEMKTLEEKNNDNSQKINKIKDEINVILAENQKKFEYKSNIEKYIKNKAKDLQVYMKSEVEMVIKDLIKNNSQNQVKNSKFLEDKTAESSIQEPEIKIKETIKNEAKTQKLQKKNTFEVLLSNSNCLSDEEESKTSNCHKNSDNLSWVIEPKKLKCDVCGHVRLIRYQCNKCKANLCVKCKEPEFIEKHCPLGHQLVKTKSKFEAECDVCLQSIDKGGQCYTDVICQADLCLSCLV